MENFAWCSEPLSTVMAFVHANPGGLTSTDARRRLLTYGPNTLKPHRQTTLLKRFITKITNPLIMLLLCAASLSAFLGQYSDFFIISTITLLSIGLDVYQEHAADQAAEQLRKKVMVFVTVLRDGKYQEVPLAEIVPGDVVSLAVGNVVPSDGRLLSSKTLMVDQSILTGESFPAQKDVHMMAPDDREITKSGQSLFMGCTVVAGEGTMVIVATGLATQYGSIARDLSVARPTTAFEKGITKFGSLLLYTALVFAAFVFGVHVFLGRDALSSLLFILALVIGFAPELMPLIITINLSKGAIRMSRKEVIVKHLPAIENFGSMDVLCTDKTGTLTENKITLEASYGPDGQPDPHALGYGYINSALQMGFRGPMETAVLAHTECTTSGYRLVDTIPFDFYRKRVSVAVVRRRENFLITKGAPEDIIAISTHYRSGDKEKRVSPEIRKRIEAQFARFSTNGLRTLAVAIRRFPATKTAYSPADESGLTFVGFLTFSDPPKASTASVLTRLSHQGIRIIVLTGDNELVSEKICRDLGLPVTGVTTGDQLNRMSQQAFTDAVASCTVFARLNPDLKKKVIETLQSQGHVVGYLGDGVNDAPSLRTADIGISVNNATDIAKESADIILLRKDLAVLSDGVEEGRKTFVNVMKYLKMGMSSNFGNMISVAVASVFLPFLPMLPAQILLNDLLYDLSQLLLANDTVDTGDLRVPRRWAIGAVKQFMLVFGPISSVFDMLTFVLLLHVFRASSPLFQTGWFVESLLTQVLIIFSIRTRKVPFLRSHPNSWFAASLSLVVILAALLPFTPAGNVFGFVPLPPAFYAMIMLLVGGYIIVVELTKAWFYRRQDL